MMADKAPKWPESLPLPFEFVEGPRQNLFSATDLKSENRIRDLIHDLYWFPDDQYFLYFLQGEGVDNDLSFKLETMGVVMKKTELYFYRHPNAAYPNDFIRVLPNDDAPQWQAEAATGQMFGRVSLSLEPARRKQIDFQESAKVTSAVLRNSEPVVEAKPNFFGIGINLHSLWHKIEKLFR